MKSEYLHELNQTELRIPEERPPENRYESRMFLGCRIPGLLPCRILHLDNRTYYSYGITSLQSLSLLIRRRELTRDDLLWILREILQIENGVEDYLLLPDHIVLDAEHIFVDQSAKKIGLIFVPFYSCRPIEGLRNLTASLLPALDRNDAGTVVFGYRFYRMLLEPDARLSTLLCFLGEAAGGEMELQSVRNGFSDAVRIASDPGSAKTALPRGRAPGTSGASSGSTGGLSDPEIGSSKNETAPATRFFGKRALWKTAALVSLLLLAAAGGYLLLHPALLRRRLALLFLIPFALFAAACVCILILLGRKEAASSPRSSPAFADTQGRAAFPRPAGIRADRFADVTPFGSAGPSPVPAPPASLISTGQDQEPRAIPIDKKSIAIGKNPDLCDAVVSDPKISRQHALIRFRDGRYFLSDCNSKNGTFRNGEPVVGIKEVPLKNGDRIRFADITYLFRTETPGGAAGQADPHIKKRRTKHDDQETLES